jgi:hypothetical protein
MTAESKRERRRKTRVRVRLPTATYEALAIVARVRGETVDATVNSAVAAYIASAKEPRQA